MEKIKIRHKDIEIHRNPVEKILMDLQKIVKNHRKLVQFSLLGVLLLAVAGIGLAVYVDKASDSRLIKYEQIMDTYRAYSPEDKKANFSKTVKDIKDLADNSYFGFAHKMGYYLIGNLYFTEKKYTEAKEYLTKYARKNSGTHFAALALQKAAVCDEELGNLNSALEIYKNLEKEYAGSIIGDQIYYNLGRIYSLRDDPVTSKTYFNKVITLFPNSTLAEKAKTRVILLGMKNIVKK